MNDNRTDEVVKAEMLALIESARTSGALTYVLMRIRMKVEHRWGDRALAINKQRLEEAKQLPDGNPNKKEDVEYMGGLVKQFSSHQKELEGLLKMLEDIERGVYPTDWRSKPDWSRNYPYEGHFRHNVIADIDHMSRVVKDNGGNILTPEQMREMILASGSNHLLAQLVREDEHSD